MSDGETLGAKWGNRTKLLIIFALFLAPLLGAWLWYANLDRWHPSSTVNHGDLIVPARPLQPFSLQTLDHGRLDENFLRRKWTLVYIGSAACAAPCRAALYNMRQVRLALGRDSSRVQRLMVLTDSVPREQLLGLLEDFPGMVVTTELGPALDSLVKQFARHSGDEPGTAGRTYIIDPLGNLMMSYAPDAEPRGLLKDLERLLKVSYVG